MKIPPRTLRDVRNEIFRVRGNLDALQKNSLFSDEDRAILVPRYSALLKKLEEEEKTFRMKAKDPQKLKA